MTVSSAVGRGLRAATAAIEEATVLDRLVRPVADVAARLTGPAPVKNALSGTWLGHRFHPLATDVPIGTWVSAAVLDLVGGRGSEQAADRLVAIGVAAALPTAAAGWSDWSDASRVDQRTGLVHAVANGAALALQMASLVARRRGDRRKARRLTAVAMGALGVGGYLGGHLTYARGVGVDHDVAAVGGGWHLVCADGELAEGVPRLGRVGDADVVVVRVDGVIRALADPCTHAGGPLHEGTVEDGCIVCPWHGSTFRLGDGSIARGPTTRPQPVYDVRVGGGEVHVRAVR